MLVVLILWGLLTAPEILDILQTEHHALENMNIRSLLQIT